MTCLSDNGTATACPLLEAARAAALTINETELRLSSEPGIEALFEARQLLAAVTYCYARRIFGSAIMHLWVKDANLRQLCRNIAPSPELLTRFCRENRQSIELCLTMTLGLIAGERMAQGYVTHVNYPLIAEEARRRLVMAAFVDSAEAEADKQADQEVRQLMKASKEVVDDTAETVFCYAG
jgi:hypothetical protein